VFLAPVGVDVQRVELTRDERRLFDLRCQIEALHVSTRDDFNLAARYNALVKLETILLERMKQRRTATTA
jgi:hypothetical protein